MSIEGTGSEVLGFFPTPRGAEGEPPSPHLASGEFKAKWPRVFALLSQAEDGLRPRAGTTLTFFGEDGRLKVAASDRHSDQSFVITLDPPEEPFDALERYLASGRVEWRKRKAGVWKR